MSNFFIPENKGTDSTGRFLDRNTNAGIYGAVIYAMILNQLGDESEALVKAAGLTPSSEDTTQWLQAIRKLYGDADTSLKQELTSKIEALTASDIAFDDSIGISASDVQEAITALHTLIKELKAKDISFEDTISLGASNIHEAILKIIQDKIMPIGATYIQFAEDNGTFDASKSPEKLFGGTWQLKYNTESVFFRTEGSLSEEGRSNGIQGDAIRNIAGTIQIMTANLAAPTGVFDYTWGFDKLFTFTAIETQDGWRHANTNFRASNVVPTSTENRTKNRKIRIYKRIA